MSDRPTYRDAYASKKCIHQDYFLTTDEATAGEAGDCAVVRVYRDPEPGPARPVSGVHWQPGSSTRLAVTYCNQDRPAIFH